MKRIFLILSILAFLAACSDDDSFTVSPTARLSFPLDTLQMDTVFSTIGSSTYSFWVYNRSREGVRLQSVRLRKGNQTGFRVNVDGSYLDNTNGSVVNGLEVRKDDSIRVFVELTAHENLQKEAQAVEDDLVFLLESGVQQSVHLKSFAWDALQWKSVVLHRDTTIESDKPIIVYGNIVVDSTVTVTFRNTQLFFHDKAGIDVFGTLLTENVLMRGDRLDHMFSYLPYDRVSGQWRGIRFYSSSDDNVMWNTEIRNAENAIVTDSAYYDESSVRLWMKQCIVHNNEGNGMEINNAHVQLQDCQITNAQGDCFAIYGGLALLEGCTVAQFYPFVGGRGAALRFTNFSNGQERPLMGIYCYNTIVTGYENDVVMGERLENDSTLYNYYFENSLLRTPAVDDTLRFVDVVWDTADTLAIQGKKHFRLIDEYNLKYDFHLDSLSIAKTRGMGCYRD